MRKSFLIRILFDILLLFSVILLPWWMNIIFIIFGIFYFNNYFEALLFGLILDALFGEGKWFLLHMNILFLGLSGCIVVSAVFLKKHIKYYE